MNPVFSIGHSDRSIDEFVSLLVRYRISALADVRAVPYSRHQPQFCKESLVKALRDAGLAYVYLGEELGGRPSARMRTQMRGKGYAAMSATETFGAGISRLMKGRSQHRIALMCAERDPVECHRALLVGRALSVGGVSVQHIEDEERSESHGALEARLLEAAGRADGVDLFASPEELLNLSYLRQERRASLEDEEVVAP